MAFRPSPENRGNLYTEKEYGDFQLRFEFQLTPGANSGVGIRAPREGDAAYVGMEIQVLDDTAPIYANLQPYQYHGSVYGVIPAKRGFLKPVGEWNSEEIIAKGSRIQVTLNGTVIVDGDILEASKNGTMDKQQHPGLQRMSGLHRLAEPRLRRAIPEHPDQATPVSYREKVYIPLFQTGHPVPCSGLEKRNVTLSLGNSSANPHELLTCPLRLTGRMTSTALAHGGTGERGFEPGG